MATHERFKQTHGVFVKVVKIHDGAISQGMEDKISS